MQDLLLGLLSTLVRFALFCTLYFKHFIAPDIILASENCSIYGPEVDMWAMGVLLFIILSGRYFL